MKDEIRTNLKMIEEHIPQFNDLSLRFIDKKKIRKLTSVWRWYVSHGYFKEGHPKPEGIASNPPIGWLHAQLKGQTVPLARDIGRCIAPYIESSIMTEHAARRIMNRLGSITGYVTREAALEDQQAHRDSEDKKTKDSLRAAKTRVDRKAEREAEHQKFVEKQGPKLAKARLKQKALERKQREEEDALLKDAVRTKAKTAYTKMKRAMHERRK